MVNLEKAKQRIYDVHGDKIKLLDYHINNEKSHFECTVCGYNWWTTISSIWKGHGCWKCYLIRTQKERKFSYEYVKEYIESFGCKLLSKEYVNCDIPIEVEFFCRHTDFIGFYSFKIGTRCDICAHIENANRQRKKPEDILNFLIENNFKFISFPNGYNNNKSKIQYKCKFGHFNEHTVNALYTYIPCKECMLIRMSEMRLGSRGSNWQGGLTDFKKYVHGRITDWKRKSMENCGYKSVITNGHFTDIHHLYSLSLIINEALENLNLKTFKYISDYSEEIISKIIEEIIRIHDLHPLGACIDRKSHMLFHSIYGQYNNTPEQFYEFQSKIASGEISIT